MLSESYILHCYAFFITLTFLFLYIEIHKLHMFYHAYLALLHFSILMLLFHSRFWVILNSFVDHVGAVTSWPINGMGVAIGVKN